MKYPGQNQTEIRNGNQNQSSQHKHPQKRQGSLEYDRQGNIPLNSAHHININAYGRRNNSHLSNNHNNNTEPDGIESQLLNNQERK